MEECQGVNLVYSEGHLSEGHFSEGHLSEGGGAFEKMPIC